MLLNQEAKEALSKYNMEAIEKFKNRKIDETMCCLDTQEPSENPTAIPDEESTDNNCMNHPDHDLDMPDDCLLDYINSQHPCDE